LALISSSDRRRVPIPNEPDAWVELRPITARDLISLQRNKDELTKAEQTVRILLLCLTAWSYETSISEEALLDLDFETFNWLDEELVITSAVRPEAEKKSYEKASSPTTDREPVGSRRS